ncbi:MAG: hypothetical protein JJE04_04995 [Acidobacteriia bacterium]|nr:hypothetical protein [Terriglobia bacterium]
MALMLFTGALTWAQDPVKVAAGQYKLIAENEDVRLLEGNVPPGSKTVMHSHPALMAVILEPGITMWTMPDGKKQQSAPGTKRGTVIAMPPQSHVSESIDKKPVKVILIEFKKPAPAAAKARKAPSLANCKVVAESPHATAQLCTGGPGSITAKHTHTSTEVLVALTDLTADSTDGAGKVTKLEVKKDSAAIAAPQTHTAKNTGKAGYELIVVDLK